MSASDTPARAPDLTPLVQDPTWAPLANAIRALAMDAVEAANSGHPGMPMGMADVATVLFANHLRFDPTDPAWPDRDRFVLSAGHGSMLLYALLHLTGYPGMGIDQIRRFRQLGSTTPGHPEYGHTVGVETTTGPLGQGLGNAVGMALAERMQAARFGADLVDHATYVIAGDGCLMEGISHEAISLAGHLKLGRLIVLWDDNHISIDGDTGLAVSDDQLTRFSAAGWQVERVDGHDPEAVSAALTRARADETRPSLIACRTTIGLGAPTKAGTAGSHGAALGATEIAGARTRLGWSAPPFEIPAEIAARWQAIGAKGRALRHAWEQRYADAAPDVRAAFDRGLKGDLGEDWTGALADLVARWAVEAPKLATRQASAKVLEVLVPAIPILIGGSADLTGSNLTRIPGQTAVTAPGYEGRYIHYGVREHAMAAAMNGIALHGGFVPYSGTFLVFADYCRPSLRLAALMGVRAIHVMTHDSIGVGEDGPTHQPVETLASLRAIPNLLVFRPADAIETAECWALALQAKDRPSVLALSREGTPALRREGGPNRSAAGAYVLIEASGPRQATLIGTGTELVLAAEAQKRLEAEGIRTAVVSMPCWELFAEQPADQQAEVLGSGGVRVAVEAALGFGWERWLGANGRFVGMAGFGASAPAKALYGHFGITVEAIIAEVKAGLSPSRA